MAKSRPHLDGSALPLYVRIQEMLRSRIVSGQLADGARLPSETELAEDFATTRATVRHALAALTFEGLVLKRKGSGTYVAPRRVEGHLESGRPGAFEEQMERSGARVGFRQIGFRRERAPEHIASTLGLATGTTVFRLRRLRFVNGDLVGFEDRWMLEWIGATVRRSSLATDSAITMTENALGVRLGAISVSVWAEAAGAEIAGLLAMRRGRPVLVRGHTFFDGARTPVLTGTAVYRGDKFRFTYEFGRSNS